MAWTKLNTWISILVFVGVMAALTMSFGNSLIQKDDIELDQDSQDYIRDYGGAVRNSNLTELSDNDVANLRNDGLEVDEDAGQSTLQSDLALFHRLRTMWTKIKGFFTTVWNIPTFLIISLGLPVAAFSIIINLFTYTIFIGLIIIAKKFLS